MTKSSLKTKKPILSGWFVAVMMLVVGAGLFVLFLVAVSLRQISPVGILCLLFFSVLTFINYKIGHNDVLYPAFVFSALWMIVFAVYVLSTVPVLGIGVWTGTLLVSFGLVFSIGCQLVSSLYVQRKLPARPLARTASPEREGLLLMLYILAVTPLFYTDMMHLGGDPALGLLAGARIELVQMLAAGKNPFSSLFSSTAPTIAVLAALANAVCWRRGRGGWVLVSSIVLALGLAVLTTGRASLLQLVLGLLTIWIFRRGKVNFVLGVRLVVPFLIGFVLVSAGLGLILKVHDERDLGVVAANQAVWYIVGGVPAFDHFLTSTLHPSIPLNHSLQQVALLYEAAGIHYPRPDVYDQFISVPFPTNVYTAFKWYVADFTWPGALLVVALLGLLHGTFYCKAKEGSKVVLFFFAVFIYPLAMTPFDDLYLGMALTRHLQVLLFAAVYFEILPRVPSVSLRLGRSNDATLKPTKSTQGFQARGEQIALPISTG